MTDTATVTEFKIDPKRLARVKHLDKGSHDKWTDGACVMEAVAYVTNLPFSDHPACACPVITAFMVAWNDALPDDERNALLLPLIPRIVNTRSSAEIANRRATMAADWLVRVHTPAWLRLAGLTAQADALSSLPEIIDFANVPALKPVLEAARRDAAAARAAAWDAARAAAWAAAWDAARAAARAAAWDAAWAAAGDAARAAAGAAAWAAAGDAAGGAARDAAWDAAGDAARAKLADTKAELQRSAVRLVERMCALSEEVREAA